MKGDLVGGGTWPVGSWAVNGHDSISRVFVIDFGAPAGAVIPVSNLSFVCTDSMSLSVVEMMCDSCHEHLSQSTLQFRHCGIINIILIKNVYRYLARSTLIFDEQSWQVLVSDDSQ